MTFHGPVGSGSASVDLSLGRAIPPCVDLAIVRQHTDQLIDPVIFVRHLIFRFEGKHNLYFEHQVLRNFYFADVTIFSALDSPFSFQIFLITKFFKEFFHEGLYTFMHCLKCLENTKAGRNIIQDFLSLEIYGVNISANVECVRSHANKFSDLHILADTDITTFEEM